MIHKSKKPSNRQQKNTVKKPKLTASKLWASLTKNLQRKSFTYSVLLHIALLVLFIIAASIFTKTQTIVINLSLPANTTPQPIVHAQAISQQTITQQFEA